MAASGSLSSAEAAYIAAGVAQGLRSDGRGCLDVRPIEIQPGVLLRASGSARLRLGATDVLVGVKVRMRRLRQGHPALRSGIVHDSIQ